MTLQIGSRFDGGAIDVVSLEHAGDIRLKVRPDSAADFAQWFYFRLSGAQGQPCRFSFDNAAACAFPEGWRDYRIVASYDREHWFRIDAVYDGQTLSFAHVPEYDVVYYAYFEPYSEERHHAFAAAVQAAPLTRLEDVGRSVEGRALTVLRIGSDSLMNRGASSVAPAAGSTAPARKQQIWIIARQHPGETMAEWFVEGAVRRLLGFGDWRGDPVARQLLDHAVFHIVANMNPDGAALGNLRTNAAGANLNREWMAPDAARSPEVLAVRTAIHASGCDMFFDVHGDEALPYVFAAGSEMLPGFDQRQADAQSAFIEFFKQASPDFQDKYGYPSGKYREEALKLASKYVGHQFGCLSLTLELPFKDNANRPDAVVGWNGARSAALGAAMLTAIARQLVA